MFSIMFRDCGKVFQGLFCSKAGADSTKQQKQSEFTNIEINNYQTHARTRWHFIFVVTYIRASIMHILAYLHM
jgi:hypothetical protein